ncbi:MAG: RNA polymerase sigma factor [Gammaproteobacteria bacterium]
MASPEEIEWIRQIKLGDMECFSRLYRKYHQQIYSLCYQFTRDKNDAEDQLQDIFMRVLEKVNSFEEKSAFSTWMTRLAVNHLINFQNRRKDLLADDFVEEAHISLQTQKSTELGISLQQAIFSLPKGYREVVILHDQLGLHHDDIAKLLDIKASSSRSQLCRARLMLREALKDYSTEVV